MNWIDLHDQCKRILLINVKVPNSLTSGIRDHRGQNPATAPMECMLTLGEDGRKQQRAWAPHLAYGQDTRKEQTPKVETDPPNEKENHNGKWNMGKVTEPLLTR